LTKKLRLVAEGKRGKREGKKALSYTKVHVQEREKSCDGAEQGGGCWFFSGEKGILAAARMNW